MAALLGRERERRSLLEEVQHAPHVRVWGPAGVGKSRLVREALPGAVHCDLSGTRDEGSVLRAVARALRLDQDALAEDAWLETAVARALERLDRVVVLDGADAALDAVAGCLARWGGTTFITTARAEEPGAACVEVGPLERADAVALWRSCLRDSNEEVAAAIVDRLDRLPLAIEWLAGRAALLGEESCLSRLDQGGLDRDPLETALDESLDGLDDEARATLERICAFHNGVHVEDLEAAGPLPTIERLRGQSLVLRVGTRLRAYRSVARSVERRAAEVDWRDAIRRHADITLARAEHSASRLVLREEGEELAAIEERFIDDDPVLAARAALLLLPLTLLGHDLEPASRRMQGLLERVEAPWTADLHLGLAQLRRRAGGFEQAREHAGAALEVRPFEAALELAHLDRQEGEVEAAMDRLVAALAGARERGERRDECLALGELGRVLQSLGRHREAQAHHVEAIALCRALGLTRREALERSLHARATHRAGDVTEAIGLHQRALEMHAELGDRRLLSAERGHLAFCHHELGHEEEAERLFRASIDGLASVGDVVLEHIERVLLARLLGDVGRFAEARIELGIARSIDAGLEMPRLERTRRLVSAWVSILEGHLEEAERELAAAEPLGEQVEVGFEALVPAVRRAVRARLGHPIEPAVAIHSQNDGLTRAFSVLDAAARGAAPIDVPRELLERSSDLRRAIVFAGPPSRRLEIASDGRSFGYRRVDEVDLSRRSAPRRLLLALARARVESPGEALSRAALIERGWPGERMRADAADKRLRTAIWTLRKAGLEGVLLTRDDGYLLDPQLPIELTVE